MFSGPEKHDETKGRSSKMEVAQGLVVETSGQVSEAESDNSQKQMRRYTFRETKERAEVQ